MVFQKQNDNSISKLESEVCKFYNGKSVFITGAAGFLGEVILEILLRCCPGIIRIFILIRPKDGLQPEDRKEKLFKKLLFETLIEKDPDVLNKVTVVCGDISHDNLGMCEKDCKRIIEEVSVVFHVAASVSFFRPLSFLVNQNVVSTDNVINLCKKLKKLDALVFTSTIFANSNLEKDVDEIIYKLPFKAEEIVQLSRNGDSGNLDDLFSKCDPNFLNYYTFSKCICENLLIEKACGLPVCIVRPSVIVSCMKGPFSGYVEESSSIVSFGHGVAKGFIRVAKVYGKSRFEYIPADVAANTHIVAAFLQATKNIPLPKVYNCTSALAPHTWEDWTRSLIELISKHPFPDTYVKPSVTLCANPLLYKFYVLLYHYIPAVIIDVFLWLSGKKFRLLKLYQFSERLIAVGEPFIKNKWEFNCENFVTLSEELNKTDAEIFYTDVKEFDMEEWKLTFYHGSPHYRVNNKIYRDNLSALLVRNFLTYLIKCLQLGIVAAICYFVFF